MNRNGQSMISTDSHALKVTNIGGVELDGDAAKSQYNYLYYINMDNVHLKTYLKEEVRRGNERRFGQKRFEIRMVLLGFSVLGGKFNSGSNGDEVDPAKTADFVSGEE